MEPLGSGYLATEVTIQRFQSLFTHKQHFTCPLWLHYLVRKIRNFNQAPTPPKELQEVKRTYLPTVM